LNGAHIVLETRTVADHDSLAVQVCYVSAGEPIRKKLCLQIPAKLPLCPVLDIVTKLVRHRDDDDCSAIPPPQVKDEFRIVQKNSVAIFTIRWAIGAICPGTLFEATWAGIEHSHTVCVELLSPKPIEVYPDHF
jgi:hypothetical protein